MKTIMSSDVLSTMDYEKVRPEWRRRMIDLKKNRRLAVGPHAMFIFENRDTLLYQIQEMVRSEKGGIEQIGEEIEAYGPLVPQGSELIATMMLEIENPERRAKILKDLIGVEKSIFIEVLGTKIFAESFGFIDDDARKDLKTSSVHFLRFRFTPAQMEGFKISNSSIVLGIDHPHYTHLAVLPEPIRQTLALDLKL